MRAPLSIHPGSPGGGASVCSSVSPFSTRCTLTGPILIDCSSVPPLLFPSSTYRILGPLRRLGPRRFRISSYPPCLLFPLLALCSWLPFTLPPVKLSAVSTFSVGGGAPSCAASKWLLDASSSADGGALRQERSLLQPVAGAAQVHPRVASAVVCGALLHRRLLVSRQMASAVRRMVVPRAA